MHGGQPRAVITLPLIFRYVFAVGFLLGVLVFALLREAGAGAGGVSPQESAAALAVAIPVVVALHEAAHAAAALLLGGSRVGFGVAKLGPLAAGIYVKVEKPLPVSRWLIVALAPLIISAASYPFIFLGGFPGAVALMISWLNAVGASGDIVFSILASSAGRGALVQDEGDRLVIVGGKPRAVALLALDAVYVFFVSFLAVAAASLAAAVLTRSEVALAGLPLAEFAVRGPAEPAGSPAAGASYEVSLSVRHGSVLAALAATGVFEAALGTRRSRRLLHRLTEVEAK